MRIGYSEVSPDWMRPTTSSSEIEFEPGASVSSIDQQPPVRRFVTPRDIPRRPDRNKMAGALSGSYLVNESGHFEQSVQISNMLTSGPRRGKSPLGKACRKQLRFECNGSRIKIGSRAKLNESRTDQDRSIRGRLPPALR